VKGLPAPCPFRYCETPVRLGYDYTKEPMTDILGTRPETELDRPRREAFASEAISEGMHRWLRTPVFGKRKDRWPALGAA
jgi:hypothetical protein